MRAFILTAIGLVLLAPMLFLAYKNGFGSIFDIQQVSGGKTFTSPATLGLIGLISLGAAFYPKFQEWKWKKEIHHKKNQEKQSDSK
jgi:hypothetical protein